MGVTVFDPRVAPDSWEELEEYIGPAAPLPRLWIGFVLA